MTIIPEKDRDILEQAIYLPMVLTILDRDLCVVKKSALKLKQPYLELIEDTMKVVHMELAAVKRHMKQNSLHVERLKRDEAFTMYLFLYHGYEEEHNYFNPRIRNKVQELIGYYLFGRHHGNIDGTHSQG